MQNMKNAVLVLTAFLLLFPYKLMAENKVISIEDGWNIYYNVSTVSECTTYPIDITDFRKGYYTIQIIEASNYLIGSIHIE